MVFFLGFEKWHTIFETAPISDKPIPGNRIPEENDVQDIPVTENVVLIAIPESEHDHIPASSTSSQATDSNTKIIDEVPDDSIAKPDKRINEIVVDDIDFHNATPIGLKNIYYNNDGTRRCANVCFFNALIQILVSIADYRNYILQSSLDNAVVTNLKRLFRVMTDANDAVHTYPYVHELEIPEGQMINLMLVIVSLTY